MSDKYTVDRVIGTKRCLKCGYPASVESYSLPEAKARLENHTICCGVVEIENAFTVNVKAIPCNYTEFTRPKFEVIMKPYKEWLNPLMRRMGK